jgi:uncharacterized protein YndB with AHSA1/START domain
VWITGEFEIVSPPHLLSYTWLLDSQPAMDAVERVPVEFHARGRATEVVITHERIPNALVRDQHEQGWTGCLDGLERLMR